MVISGAVIWTPNHHKAEYVFSGELEIGGSGDFDAWGVDEIFEDPAEAVNVFGIATVLAVFAEHDFLVAFATAVEEIFVVGVDDGSSLGADFGVAGELGVFGATGRFGAVAGGAGGA